MGNRAAAISEYEVAMRLDESIGKHLGALLDEDERDHQARSAPAQASAFG
jgi:hypothetical protein